MGERIISVDETLWRHLQEIARQEQRPVDEIAGAILRRYAMARVPPPSPATPVDIEEDTKDLFLLIARSADELGETSEKGDISERSREILHTEYPEHLMRRLREQDSDTDEA